MLNISEQFANAGKHSFQTQLALLQKIGHKAFESTQKIIGLNFNTGKTLLEDGNLIAQHWIQSKHPFQFAAKESHEMQPGMHHFFNYERELAHILTSAQAELLTFAFSEMVELQDELADLTSHLHEHNKAKQDYVKQAAHAYSAEIKSLYPDLETTGHGKEDQPKAAAKAAKPAKTVKASVKPGKASTQSVASTTTAKAAKATKAVVDSKPQAKAETKVTVKTEVKPKAVAKATPKAQKPKAAAKPVAKLPTVHVEAKPDTKASKEIEIIPHAEHPEHAARPPMPRAPKLEMVADTATAPVAE